MKKTLVSIACGCVLLCVPTLASAQTAPDARMFAGALAGVTFGTETGAVAGGRFGFKIGKSLHLAGEIGRVSDVTPKSISDQVDALVDEFDDDVPINLTFKVPTMYYTTVIRWSKGGGKVGPYVEGGFGAARLKADVHLQIDGEDFTDDLKEAVGTEMEVTKSMLFFAGGVNVGMSSWASVDLGYRYTHIFTQDPAVNVSAVYGMVVFKIK